MVQSANHNAAIAAVATVCRVFDASAFRADLKDVLRTAGIEGTPVLLFLEERHLATDPGERLLLIPW